MKLWTDYPFREEDASGKPAPLRKVSLISFDGNKYVQVKYRGKTYSFKAGYLYNRPFRMSGQNLKRRLNSARLGVRAALRAVEETGATTDTTLIDEVIGGQMESPAYNWKIDIMLIVGGLAAVVLAAPAWNIIPIGRSSAYLGDTLVLLGILAAFEVQLRSVSVRRISFED